MVDVAETGPWPPSAPLYQYSKLILPKDMTEASVPAVIMIHGAIPPPMVERCLRWTGAGALLFTGWDRRNMLVDGWAYMMHLGKKVAHDGFAVLVIGLSTLKAADQHQGTWAKALNSAIDHVCHAVPKVRAGVSVDTKRIAIVGHSAGGGGVLNAAAHEACDRVAAVVSLNPSHPSVEQPGDHMAECKKFFEGANFSGEYGEGVIPHLAKIKAPTLLYGTLTEYNTEMSFKPGCCFHWPVYPCTFEQIGAAKKELYVDNVAKLDHKGSNLLAHMWLSEQSTLETYACGVPLKVICSFLRRHCKGSDEAPPEPENAHEWKVVG